MVEAAAGLHPLATKEVQRQVATIVDAATRERRIVDSPHETEKWRRRILARREAAIRQLPPAGAVLPTLDLVWDGEMRRLSTLTGNPDDADYLVTPRGELREARKCAALRAEVGAKAKRDAEVLVAAEICGLDPHQCWRVVGRRSGAGNPAQAHKIDTLVTTLLDLLASSSTVELDELGEERVVDRRFDGFAAKVFVAEVLEREPELAAAVQDRWAQLRLWGEHELRRELEAITQRRASAWMRYRRRLETALVAVQASNPGASSLSVLGRLQPG